MWARVEGAVRGAIWDLAWRAGTPAVAVPLLALAAVQVGVTVALSPSASHAFATSWGSWLIAGALVVDALVATVRATPAVQGMDGRVRWAPPGRAGSGAFLVACGYLAIAAGLAASLGARERLEVRCALGEPCSAAPAQIVARDPVRPFSPGPFPVQFTVEAAEGPGEGASGRVEVRWPGGKTTRMTRRRPAWVGWGRFVRPVGTGDVLRYEIRGPSGTSIEAMFAKLDLDPPGKVDSIRSEIVPYRIYVRAASPRTATTGPRSLDVAVYRGKLSMGQARLAVGGELPFEGHVVAFPEWRPWVQLELVSDPGIPLALLGGLLAATGLALRARRWTLIRNAATPGGAPGA